MEQIQKKERNSNFELLRLILMFLIVIHHSIVHGLQLKGISSLYDLPSLIQPNHMLMFSILNCLCIPAVNIFLLITGYFKLKPTKEKALKLGIAMLLYTIVFSTIPYIAIKSYGSAISSLLIFSHSAYWFIVDYFLLMLFAPMINQYIDGISRHQYNYLIIGMLLISCYLGFVWQDINNTNGYTLFQFVMMYTIGGYIRRFDIRMKSIYSLTAYLICSVVCGWLVYYAFIIGKGDFAWRLTYYNNPLIVTSAISLFLCFKEFSFKSKFINKLAASAVAIYFVQSSRLFRHFQYGFIGDEYSKMGGGILLIIIMLSLMICAFALAIDQCQKHANRIILNVLLNRIFVKSDKNKK
jgi:surface polysaccharide O-acyltransferase-like enzyme